MALLRNNSLLNNSSSRQFGGGIASGYSEFYNPWSATRNRHTHFASYSATPNGYLHPMAFVLPKLAGGMSTYNPSNITLNKNNAVLVNAQYRTANASINISVVDAALSQIFFLSATGAITTATASAILSSVVNGQGSGTITLSVSSAVIGGILPGSASSSITFSTAALLTAIGHLEAEAGGPTPLSPEGLAAAVWGALAIDNDEPGTMGELLNSSGAAANPWLEVIESGLTAAEVLRIILAVQAGKTNIVDNGGGSATVTFRDVADTKNRVEADMQDSERIDVTLDGG